MSEPTLENIEDYNTLKGEKKRVVWGVIIVGLLIGALYVTLSDKYEKVDDSLGIQDTIKSVPIK